MMTTNAPVKADDLNIAVAALMKDSQADAKPDMDPFLKLDKTGKWVYGQDRIEPKAGQQWVVNTRSFAKGFVAWAAGAKVMAGLGEPPVNEADLPLDVPAEMWKIQVAVQLKGLGGYDDGQQVMFSSSSKGGRSAWHELLAVLQASGKDLSAEALVVELNSGSWISQDYGRIFTPEFTPVKWVPLGEPAPVQVAAEPAPNRKRRRATA